MNFLFLMPSNRFERKTRVESVLLVLLGIYLLVTSFNAGLDIAAFRRMEKLCTKTTKGAVTLVSKQHPARQAARYITIYVYTADGEEYSSSSDLRERERLSVGDDIIVNYDPYSPKTCYTPYDVPSWRGVAVPAVGGVLCILYGTFTFKKLSSGKRGYNAFDRLR